MIQQDPLAALHPLREPEAIAWWPPAPGWWLLSAILLAAIAGILFLVFRRHRANAYRRQGTAQLGQLYVAYEENRDARGFITAGNALLKSIAIQAYPSDEIAPSYGQDWVHFLNASTNGNTQFDEDLGDAIYRQDGTSVNAELFNKAAHHWIIHHRGSA